MKKKTKAKPGRKPAVRRQTEEQRTRQGICDWLEENFISSYEEGILLVDGHDRAFLGLVEQFGLPPRAVYSTRKILERLVEDGMTLEEAREYFDFNILGAFMGETTPAFLTEYN